jgi:hypothetical protein
LLHKCKVAPQIDTIQLTLVFAPEPFQEHLVYFLVFGDCAFDPAAIDFGFREVSMFQKQDAFV